MCTSKELFRSTVHSPKRKEVLFVTMKMYPQFKVCALRGTPVCLLSCRVSVLAQANTTQLYFTERFPCEGPVLIDTHSPAPAVISSTFTSTRLESVQKEEWWVC